MKKVLAAVVVTAAVFAGVAAQPAPGVVHEIYAAWCAGKGEIVPPGISDDTKKNFAAPVLRGGVVTIRPYLDGFLIDFDFDKPQSKVIAAPTGPPIVQIGPGLYLERFILDPDFPGFLNCAKLASLSG
ncbi:MAG TPA: hypothetical protein VMN35_00370 [Gaiellaceae bacterium]|nr:hypothetical protein [Gaiellaceae bacterium]